MRIRNQRNAARRLAKMATTAVLAAAVITPAVQAQGPSSSDFEFGVQSGSFIARAHETMTGGTPGSIFTHDAMVFTDLVKAKPEVSTAGDHIDASGLFELKRDPLDPRRPNENLRDVVVDAPQGFVGNPQAVEACEIVDFYLSQMSDCAKETQVGMIAIGLIGLPSAAPGAVSPIHRLQAPYGKPALFGFKTGHGDGFTMVPTLRPEDNYAIRVTVENSPIQTPVTFATATLWGVPYDSIHDPHRRDLGGLSGTYGHSVSKAARKAFLINPMNCDGRRLTTHIRMRSWQRPNRWPSDSFTTDSPATDCDRLAFGTETSPVDLAVQPVTRSASSPTGLEVKLRLPFNDRADGLANPPLRDVEVLMPEGMSVNPSAGQGLEGCSSAQIALKTDEPVRCPGASKIGSLRVKTPLLTEELTGSVYQASQEDNPFGSLLALYFVVESKERGILVKIPGRVDLDPATGRIKSTFADNPQLPFTELDMRLKGGPRAPLVTPPTCGVFTTRSTLTPWSHPHTGPPLVREDSFEITSGPDGTPCPAEGSARPFSPELDGGAASPTGRGFSAFTTRFVRSDADQEIRRVGDVVVPKGLVAKLAGVPLCADGAADAGRCGEGSRVGRVEVAAGVGPSPLWVPQAGKQPTAVHLAGPYRGAPYSLAIVVPAQAGPLDLGTVVARVALHIDRRTAQVTATVEQSRHIGRDGSVEQVWEREIPLMLRGIPLYQRDIRVVMDRDQFMLNPSNCDEQQVQAELGSRYGKSAGATIRFQVADCAALPFEPRLTMRLTGKKQVRTGKHPGIRAQVTQRGAEAGIGRAKVTLPRSLALDVNNAQALCEFEDGTKPDLENHCPKGSIVGKAVARTPLLDRPLEGSVYFVKNVRRDPKTGNAIRTLPMIIAALRGEVAINLVGESDTTKAGRLVNTFAEVPDAPVSKFNLNINGGSNGIIAVTRTRRALINLCARPKGHVADADMDGHNGKVYDRDVRMKTPCSKRQVKKAQRAAKKRR